ncbi:protein CLP1 homolog [Nephila pilipes]|uniref:Protein CLP1 homolog n=1 Tax=Nephila pilipes TaxID=299642 RepID=A0A8X6MDL5_NEPPI|nr:protein CLP1 homolog [Nephila pilipes]
MAVSEESITYRLEVENELRLTVGNQAGKVKIQLITGLAELYGTEMEVSKIYNLPALASIALFTWQGCTIKVTGKPEYCYVVAETQMILKIILHASIEERRMRAENENRKGPVTFIVGPTDTGKNNLCRFLLNYAAYRGRRPVFIDLDVDENSISIPDSIGVITVTKPADIVTGFKNQDVQLFPYGHDSPGHNIIPYILLIKKFGETLQSELSQMNQITRYSGAIINSSGCMRGWGYRLIHFAAMTFKVDIVCVLEDAWLYQRLLKEMPRFVQVLFMPKMENAVERSRDKIMYSRITQLREYFYGPFNELQPFTFDVKYSEIQVLKVIPKLSAATDSFSEATFDHTSLAPVPLDHNLINRVLALSSADTVDNDLILSHAIGFIFVKGVKITENVITILSLQPGPLPKKILLMGDSKFLLH